MMNKQDVVDALTIIFKKYGIGITHEPQKFKFAIWDLLHEEKYRDERSALEHALGADSLWILLNESPITDKAAKKAVNKLKKEKHMPIDDTKFVVQCMAEAYEKSIGITRIQKEIGTQNKSIQLFEKKEENKLQGIGIFNKNSNIEMQKGKEIIKFLDAISLYIYKCVVFVGITIIACITVADEKALLLGTLTYFPGIIFDISSLAKNDRMAKDHYILIALQRFAKILLQIWLGVCIVLMVFYEQFNLYVEVDFIIHKYVPISMIAFGIGGPLLEMKYNLLSE